MLPSVVADMTRAIVPLAFSPCGLGRSATPGAESAIAVYDARENAIHVTVSGLQPASKAVLIVQDGRQYLPLVSR